MENTDTVQFVISIGSNTVNKLQAITDVISRLDTVFTHIKSSSIYATEALNRRDADYCNCVVIYSASGVSPDYLTGELKRIEKEFGRSPELKTEGIVPIDLDLVIYNGIVLREKDFKYDYFQIGWNEIQHYINSPT